MQPRYFVVLPSVVFAVVLSLAIAEWCVRIRGGVRNLAFVMLKTLLLAYEI